MTEKNVGHLEIVNNFSLSFIAGNISWKGIYISFL